MPVEISYRPSTRGWTIAQWRNAYLELGQSPQELMTTLHGLIDSNDPAWISVASIEQLQHQFDELETLLSNHQGDHSKLPLYGVPFAIKDNIDAAHWPTTAACPEFTYDATHDAEVVHKLRKAGAILIGKTNLDQFATGLVGTRSPYGVVPNSFNEEYISGGSSSGSASVVARGLVPFALGTDTAGSGRVPAAFNNIVGLKPTKGWVSNHGLLPACKTLDCITAFALCVEDAAQVVDLMAGYDALDAYSRVRPSGSVSHFPEQPRLAVPTNPEFLGDNFAAEKFTQALSQLRELGAELVEIDFAPFAELAALLYQGPWVAERYAVLEQLLTTKPLAVHPVVCSIVEGAARFSAIDAFIAEYRRAQLTRQIHNILADVDALVVPTTPTIFTIQQVLDEPITANSALGTYTNFTNLADLCALALPAGVRRDGLPAGITLIAPAWHDWALVDFGLRWQAVQILPPGAPDISVYVAEQPTPHPVKRDDEIVVAVVGAHLRGMPLNYQLTSRQARFLEETVTAHREYRLYALPDSNPPKPGLKRTPTNGAPIVVELWALTPYAFGEFTAEVPPPLGIGNIVLADGRIVKGFICESEALENAKDITDFGGWRAYLNSV